MSIWKRGRNYWTDVTLNGVRYREPLKTTDRREAIAREKARIVELVTRPPDPSKVRAAFASLPIDEAILAYSDERRAQVSNRMVAYWKENAKPLASFFKAKKLRDLAIDDLNGYQRYRSDAGRAPKTINGELSVLRQVLLHARVWYRFEGEYKPLKNTKPPVGQALTDEEQRKLFEVAKTKPAWKFAYVAAILSFFCGMRACEIRALQWRDVDWTRRRLSVRRSKTPAGWRDPSLNNVCLEALTELKEASQALGFANDDHFVFPWHGKSKVIDPSRPMASWRSAWRSIKKAAGLKTVRFHDGRHTALTRLAEAGQPDWVIQAQMGHVSPSMMKTYSHVRRAALDTAAAVLEPVAVSGAETATEEAVDGVTSQTESQSVGGNSELPQFVAEFGSSGWTRTSNPPVNRLAYVSFLVGFLWFSPTETLLIPRVRGKLFTDCSRREDRGYDGMPKLKLALPNGANR